METTLSILWGVAKSWWWAPLPFLLWRPFLFMWLWWRREIWSRQQKFIMLEVKIPKEVIKPLRAMDQVFAALWGNLYDPTDWWEKWIEGKMLLSYTFDIVGIDGEAHFYIRCPEANRNAVESSIYSQYPDAELSIVDDYTKYIPQDIPNKDWDLWGTDYRMQKEDVFPIKTYHKFFEERPDAPIEEKRLDPLAALLEGMARLRPGEQLWIQIVATPVSPMENNFVARGRDIADKLSKRVPKAKKRSALIEAGELIITGQEAAKEEKADMFPPEMRLTPGEKDMVEAVERKTSQSIYECNLRFIYLGKKEVFFRANIRIPLGFFQQFATSNLNLLRPWGQPFITKVPKKWFLPLNIPFIRNRRLYIRKRKLVRYYIKRCNPFFPKPGGRFILSTEELATIYHFPTRVAAPAPSVSRIESKKGEAPPGLPSQ